MKHQKTFLRIESICEAIIYMDDFLYGTRDFFLSVSNLADSACPNCSDCPLVLPMENKSYDLFTKSILGSFKYRLCSYACGCFLIATEKPFYRLTVEHI